MGAATVVPTAVLAVRAWPVRGPALAVESSGHPAVADAWQTGFSLVLALSVVALVAVVVRFRRSHGVERQQIKWFAYGAVIGIPLGLPAEVPFWGPILELAQPPLLFAGLGIGMFRYRLYDVDRVINRTLVYGLLTAVLGLAYAAGSLIFVLVAGAGSDPPSWLVAAATLVVAALFRPARRRIQAVVDRRFNRRKYDAAKTVEAFSAHLRDQVNLDALSAELLAVADQTMQPTKASLWLRPTLLHLFDCSRRCMPSSVGMIAWNRANGPLGMSLSFRPRSRGTTRDLWTDLAKAPASSYPRSFNAVLR
jgi:hypothetical protein